MGKNQQQQKNQANKGHKTLREKLRKKREEEKRRKKEKSEKHKLYNAQQSKKKYFAQANKKKREDGIKEHRLRKHIEKFVDIYEDDVEDFYELFGTLDEGGAIDITDVANPLMQKVLKKMFKYLPLSKNKLEYKKKDGATTKLKPLMKELVTRQIQNYLENGTQSQQIHNESEDQSSNNSRKQKKAKKKRDKVKNQDMNPVDKQVEKRIKTQIKHQQIRAYEDLKLYPERVAEKNQSYQSGIGPCISAEQRQYLAKMFDQQINNGVHDQQEQQAVKLINQEDKQFERILSMSSTAEKHLKKKGNNLKPNIDDIPQELLAQGSARIGQKQQIDPEQIQEYNKIYRPRKLIEQHQQMRKLGKFAELDKDGHKKRVPFDRERDIVNGRSRQFMNNGVFFDFKERMTKPKSSNNFL